MNVSSKNPYCERLSIPVPRLEDFAGRSKVKPFHLMALALLENGGPLDLEAIVDRMLAAGIPETLANIRTLQKAWAGKAPVIRGLDGRFGLDTGSSEMSWILLALALGPYQAPAPTEPPPPIVLPADDVPLTREEVEAAARDRDVGAVSVFRRAAATLDAIGEPMSVEALEHEMLLLMGKSITLTARDIAHWRGDLVKRLSGDRLVINRESDALRPLRQAIRKFAATTLMNRAQEAQRAALWGEQDAIRKERERQAAVQAQGFRRALLRVVPDPAQPTAAIVLDVTARTFRFFRTGEHDQLLAHLRTFEVLIGLQIRDTLQALGTEPDDWRLSDLRPSQKTMKIDQRGRTLSITPELLIAGTTGISKPLGDAAKIAEYLANSDWRKLARRLESDAKALFAHYQYGVLHRHVRLRWGFLDECLNAEWDLPGDPSLYNVLAEAKRASKPVEVVIGSAPGWENPWARAHDVEVVDVSGQTAVFRSMETGTIVVDLTEIQAVRPAIKR